ncbi:MAG TPA: hypothetical protein VL404_08005, partial [Candidatus Eisenbacteria bacterium]|nr:hypothetical protein [Candidatus Eisenbacteria bacterium]
MRKKALHLALILAAGWLGGLSSHWLFPMRSADAKDDRILKADQLWIYASDGQHRLQMGTYQNAGEKDLPLLGLTDNEGRLRLLLRLVGDKGSP